MMERTLVDSLKRSLIEEARTDTVGLWAVLWQVKEDMPAIGPDEAKRTTLMVIREMLAEGSVVAGEFVDQDEDTMFFSEWALPVDETMARIELEWMGLGREPNPGEIVWFVDRALLPLTARKHPMGRDWRPS